MTAIVIVYLIVLAATIFLGYRLLNASKWKKTNEWKKGELIIELSEESSKTIQQILPRLCNDGNFRSFTKEHDDMIEHNTLKYRQMKFGEVTDKNHARKLGIAETEGSK